MPSASPHPHVAWRDGRPRFTPAQKLRAAGHKGQDLRHADGRWFSRGEAVDWSIAFQATLAKAATPARRSPKVQPARPSIHLYTIGRLFEDWFASPRFCQPADRHEAARARAERSAYSPKTVRSYRQLARVLESHDAGLWAAPVDALAQAHLVNIYDELVAARGLATARGAMLVLSSALAWGKRRGRYAFRNNGGVNPARDLGMASGRKRLRIGTKAEIAALISTADRLGWHDMGDMILLGLWTGQRQEDRLLMVDRGLVRGRRVFRQMKTGAIVSLTESPELEARLRAARRRREDAGVVNARVALDEVGSGADPQKPGRRIQTWQPWPDDGDRYRKRFAELRAEAAKICPSLMGGPGLLRFHEADLRATAVTWMAIGGAEIPQIIAVTGHSLASATNILKHYLATYPEMADAAIARMVEFYEGDGEAEFGL